MKIAFFEIKGWEKKILNKQLKGHQLFYFEEALSEDNVSKIKGFDIVSVFIYSKVNKKVIANLPKLKLITTRSTGFDHIDLKEASKRKIPVCNVPSYGENTVAEHTFALILSLSRNIHKSYMRSQKNDYSIEGLKGFDLKGKTIGIIGAGKIGMHVIRMARAFSMRVLVFDVNQDPFMADVLGFEYASFEQILKESDILSLHAPHNKYTHHMINMDNISKIKRGAILINTSRGGLVDIDALIEALDKKIIAGAGLDVIEGEELIKEEKQLLYDKEKTESLGYLIKDHLLLNKDNVVFTPHIAFYSQEALLRILETTGQNINAYFDENLINLV
ncbi:hydroxyacid dehydrogenase [Candidatus Parcubacteria bacterium]|nr:MAG: hydroxyacid dehydrogenase [Candidatus Parcubacteria bacterium]